MTTTPTAERTLKNIMPFPRKIGAFFAFLQQGGELEIGGHIYVWCDNLVTREETNFEGETKYFGIDGLAVKSEGYDTLTGKKKPYYLGQNDMAFGYLYKLIEALSEEQLFEMTASIALLKGVKQRNLRSDTK